MDADSGNHLKLLLQVQLASDASAVRYLPYCLSTLSPDSFKPSSHSTKWTSRINSLLHAKESGTRWAGLCLAYKSSLLSQSLMIDAAQSWIVVTLPLLSRNELLPTIKAAVRLLRLVFSNAIDIPEFQRQVSVPNIVKFTSSLISLADNHMDVELKTLCMNSLAYLIPLYSTTHRASFTALSAFSLRYLKGSTSGYTNESILHAASRLYSVLPLTGGKVGATSLWRKSLDDSLAFGWEAFYSLRATFLTQGHHGERPLPTTEPQIHIPLYLDRLRCTMVVINDLIQSPVERPVQVPLGNLFKFATSLLISSSDEEVAGFFEPTLRCMETAALPELWQAGCRLLMSISIHFPHHLDPHAGRLLVILVYHLEQSTDVRNRLPVVKTINLLLKSSHPLYSTILPNRLVKAILPLISPILSTSQNNANEVQTIKSKKSKKRSRNYEGDENFQMARKVICSTTEDEDVVFISLDVLKLLFNNSGLSSSLHSLIARIITSMLLYLPRASALSLSPRPGFVHNLYAKVQEFCLDMGSGTTSVMSKTLPFAISSAVSAHTLQMQHDIGLLLHPRVPPVVRTMPHLECISFFNAEQSQEENDALSVLEIGKKPAPSTEIIETVQEDISMSDLTPAYETTKIAPIVTSAPTLSSSPLSFAQQQPAQPNLFEAASMHQQKAPATHISDEAVPDDQKSKATIKAEPKKSSDVVTIPIPQEADEEEEMPAINMESDSEDEGDF